MINRGWMVAVVLLMAGCDGAAVSTAPPRGSDVLGIQFLQKDQPATLSSDLGKTSVYLADGRFSIRVPNLSAYPAVQICAAADDDIFATIDAGRPLAEIRCFSPGTGVAVDPSLKESGYPLGLYGGQAHNYFHHSLTINSDDVRTINIGTIVDGMREGGLPFTQNLYLIVVLDKNSDKIVDANEFELFYIPARV